MIKQSSIKYIFSALTIITTALLAGCDQASGEFKAGEFAEVIATRPLTKTVSVPREECRDEVVTLTREVKDPNQIVGTVTGAVIGGVLGNEIGSGKGNDAATVGGAVLGGYAGNQAQEEIQERNTYQETRQNCQTVYDSHEEAAGYEVTYRLNGMERKITLDHDPGRQIAVVDGNLVLED